MDNAMDAPHCSTVALGLSTLGLGGIFGFGDLALLLTKGATLRQIRLVALAQMAVVT